MPWGAAIGAVGALGAAEINKSSKAGGSSSSESPETRGASNQALGQAETIANTGYTPYTGAVVQPLSASEQQGSALARPDSANNKMASSLFEQSANDIAGIKQYNADNIKSYMDPYVQATLNPVLQQENAAYDSQRSSLLNSKAGAFGGDRSALEERSLETSHSQALQKDVGDAYSKAYTNAQTAFFQDQEKQINAARTLDQVGGDVSKLNTQQIQDLMATGGLERALGQKQLDFNLQQFTENRDWSTHQLQPLLQAIAASKGVQTNTQLYGQPNVAGTAIGAAATIAGAYFTGGASSGVNTGQIDAESHVAQDNVINNTKPQEIQVDNSSYSPWDESDQRLKTDVVLLGYLPSGIPWYEFRYIYDAQRRRHEGVLAQEVAPVIPEAVGLGEDGFLRVNYSRIH